MEHAITTEPVKERDLDRVYRAVNATWGISRWELPALDREEAVTAYRKLWKVATRAVAEPGGIRFTSGNRNNIIRAAGGTCVINPDRGWWGLVHSISHYAHYRKHPRARDHDPLQANLERRLIEHVVEQGWLDGRLKRAVKAKAKPDVRAVRAALVDTKIKTWESKKRRAETALKKLYRQRRYYSATMVVPPRGLEPRTS